MQGSIPRTVVSVIWPRRQGQAGVSRMDRPLSRLWVWPGLNAPSPLAGEDWGEGLPAGIPLTLRPFEPFDGAQDRRLRVADSVTVANAQAPAAEK